MQHFYKNPKELAKVLASIYAEERIVRIDDKSTSLVPFKVTEMTLNEDKESLKIKEDFNYMAVNKNTATYLQIFSDSFKDFVMKNPYKAEDEEKELIKTTALKESLPLSNLALSQYLEKTLGSGLLNSSLSKRKGEIKPELVTLSNIKNSSNYKNKELLLRVRNNIVSAVLSDNYKMLDIDILADTLIEKFPYNLSFEYAYMDQERTSIIYKVGNSIDRQIKSILFPKTDIDLDVLVTLTSGDLGTQSVVLRSFIRLNHKTKLMLGSKLSLSHIGDNLDKRWEEYCRDYLIDLIRVSTKDLNELKDLRIKNPNRAIKNLLDYLNAPTSDTILIPVQLFKSFYRNKSCTAFDIYVTINEVLSNMEAEDYSLNSIIRIREDLSRLVKNSGFKQFDEFK